jgi:2-oxoisovalerate dehydrogenase E2 component (dihydrolipoyl transacylase)
VPEYLLPDVGEGLTEAEIVTWKVKVGDQVAINDVVVEIETAKSLVELPSPYAGEVTAILVAEGETVPVGTPIIAIGAPDPAAQKTAPSGSGDLSAMDLSNPAASGGGEGESLVGRMKADRGPQRRARRPLQDAAGERFARAGVHDVFNQGVTDQQGKVDQLVSAVMHDAEDQAGAAGEPTASPAAPAPAPSGIAAGDVRVLAKPPVRKLAKDLGVDLRALTPTGPGGSISRADVEAVAGAPEVSRLGVGAPRTSTTGVAGERETREPIKGVRKMMASAMTESAFTAPHVTEWVTIDATATLELVARLKERREFKGVKVSPLLVFARAVLLAMRRTPMINSYWDEAAGEVVVKNYVNLGIAAATPRGLVVPNVKDADSLGLVDLARSLEELTATAREGRTQPADMAGGTFTITNVGVFGVDAGTPIINPGESAILCMGAIQPKPWVVGDQVVPRQVTTLALSFDHRHIDGATGSQFLADVAGIVADPATALLF